MFNKTLCLTLLSAFVLSGAYAEDQVSEDQTIIVSDTQVPSEESQLADGDDENAGELIGRCPCRDRKDNPAPTEGSVLTCGCDEEESATLANVDTEENNDTLANLETEEESAVAHHGEDGEHDLVCDESENNGVDAAIA